MHLFLWGAGGGNTFERKIIKLILFLKIFFPGIYLKVCEKIHIITMVITTSIIIIPFLLHHTYKKYM